MCFKRKKTVLSRQLQCLVKNVEENVDNRRIKIRKKIFRNQADQLGREVGENVCIWLLATVLAVTRRLVAL